VSNIEGIKLIKVHYIEIQNNKGDLIIVLLHRDMFEKRMDYQN